MSERNKKRALLIGIAACVLLLVLLEVLKIQISAEGQEDIYFLITAAVGSTLFVLAIFYCSYTQILKIHTKTLLTDLLFVLPCLAVAVNNFPILPFLTGKAQITGKIGEILLYLLVCLATGLFEELVFRGYVLMLFLEKRKDTVKGLFRAVIASSAIFGAVHIFNIFAGAAVPATLLQVGYSFLVGGMCGVVLIKTRSVWYSVLIHGIYNFAGGVIPKFGTGIIWDAPTVIITAVLAVTVAIYLVIALGREKLNEK